MAGPGSVARHRGLLLDDGFAATVAEQRDDLCLCANLLAVIFLLSLRKHVEVDEYVEEDAHISDIIVIEVAASGVLARRVWAH